MEKDDDLWYCGDCKDAHMDEEEESVCDDEQRSYGARGAPAPESDDEDAWPSEANCDDCGRAIRDTENLDTCWTNDGKIFWCEYCREEYVEKYIQERDGDD